MSNSPTFITTEALAERWGLSVGTLCNHRVRGTGPTYVKIGHSVRYALADIEQHEAAGTVQAVA